jgi:hypothetical protein
MPRRIDERVRSRHQKKVTPQHLLRLTQFFLCLLKVKVNIQSLDKICDWVIVFIILLLNDAD